MGSIFGGGPSMPARDTEADRRAAEAEAKAKADKEALEAKQREDAEMLKRGLRGRRALQSSAGELGFDTSLGAGR
ncbi:MAG: hypothetical protein LCH62_15850 [Proteobacteria bacterium]|nr:hypothetical protein [Pseudomonadota bacterium]